MGTCAIGMALVVVPGMVVGSLLASHALAVLPSLVRLKANALEPVVVAVRATVVSDTLSLVVFAVCLSNFQGGCSVPAITLQLVEILVFVPMVLFGLSWVGARVLKRMEDEENAYLVLLLLILAVNSLLGEAINLPGIVGAFLAGLAFRYTAAERMTVWSLTPPQVAATLAATLAPFHARDPAGRPRLDEVMRNACGEAGDDIDPRPGADAASCAADAGPGWRRGRGCATCSLMQRKFALSGKSDCPFP